MRKILLISLSFFIAIAATVIAILSIGYNEVLPGEVYRYRQLSGEDLSHKIDQLGIRTIVNLRGEHPDEKWYLDELQATKNKSVALFSFPMNSKKLPNRNDLQGLIEVIMNADRPMLVHCEAGNERSGMAAAIALLLTPGKTLEDAYQEVSLKYFNFTDKSVGRQLLIKYQNWLSSKGTTHTPDRLLEWVKHEYAGYRGDFRFWIDTVNDVALAKYSTENGNPQIMINRSENAYLKLSGWAIDMQNISPANGVEILLGNKSLGASQYGQKRADVASSLGDPRYTDTGWQFAKKVAALSPGCYALQLRLTRTRGTSWTSDPQAQICFK
jgi:protein tyrosine phosphatase (PTP) superfamily phosphohydrolase (DUF442 family)